MKHHFNNKPVFIIDCASFDLEQTDALMGLFELRNHGAVSDILDMDRIEQLLMHVEPLVTNEIELKNLHVFADDAMSAADLAGPEFLQLIYDSVSSFDVEIYFG